MIVGLQRLDELAALIETNNKDAYRYFAGKIDKEWKRILIQMNIDNLELGIRQDGSDIEKTPVGNQQSTRYERYTVYLKSKRGDLSVSEDSPVTLHETGTFYDYMDIKVGLNEIYFINLDPKGEKLKSIWGQVLGISIDQLEEFILIVIDDFKKWVKGRYEKFSK